ncbi:DUF1501 domain-containing protein [Aquisphaera insulae]|uniref:DUF1501 domain-containing protein n=1 Tax=Aquisphaera insulae TaxID=2712864 RepID=UPI0013EA2001|nr:DUF1501 domain-containing protein [Aquisphaera insulae]
MSGNLSSRRRFLEQAGAGFGGLALSAMLADEARAAGAVNPLAVKSPHFPAKVKRVILLFMFGGPSHLDTFDYKPRLTRDAGKPLAPEKRPRVVSFPNRMGNLVGSPFEFRQHGRSGTWVSSLFPEVARRVDDLCVINSMHCSNSRHGGAVLEWHTGSDTFVRPSFGSWVTYGLGTENQNVPGYITICQDLSQGGANNFGSGFLPAIYQGTTLGHSGMKPKDARIPFIGDASGRRDIQRLELDLIADAERRRAPLRGPDSELDARVASFELAFRMQAEAPELHDLSRESKATRDLYGLDDPVTADFALQCLLARRYSERGVRFVQCNVGGWDAHNNLKADHGKLARSIDRPIAGLLADLKGHGLWDDTLVIWGGEFGRTPTCEGTDGRDHNPHGYTMWLAGGGVKLGITHGKTDEYGYFAVEDKVHVHDLHATILHLLGLDHKRLTYRHAGRDFRLTDVYGELVEGILA